VTREIRRVPPTSLSSLLRPSHSPPAFLRPPLDSLFPLLGSLAAVLDPCSISSTYPSRHCQRSVFFPPFSSSSQLHVCFFTGFCTSAAVCHSLLELPPAFPSPPPLLDFCFPRTVTLVRANCPSSPYCLPFQIPFFPPTILPGLFLCSSRSSFQ